MVTWVNQGDSVLSEISQAQKDRCQISHLHVEPQTLGLWTILCSDKGRALADGMGRY